MATTESGDEKKVAAAAGVVKSVLLVPFPWLLVVVDTYSIRTKAEGIRRWNLVWAPALYYLTALSVATVVLAPSLSVSGVREVSLQALGRAMALFPVFVLNVLGEQGLSPVSIETGVVLAVGSGAIGLGYVLNRVGTAAHYRRLTAHDGGRIILPMSKIRQHDGVHSRTVPFSRSKSVLVLGESGSGKTESIRLMTNQLQSEPDEPFIVFDYKDEYREDVFADDEYVHLSLRDGDVTWNLFEEADEERDLREFGRMLFPDENEQSENAFFEKGARQIFVAVTRVMYREFDNPHNAHIQRVFRKHTFRTLPEIFDGHPDLFGNIQEYLDEENPRTSQSVFAFVTQTVEDVFIDDFAAESGAFSIREYMADPDGQKLILDIPQQNTQSVAPAFRFFIDQAIKHSLQDGDRNAYFVLDEFARVPDLDQIENLTGAGRAMGSQAILGLQGISQLRRHYDEDYANDILAGVTQEILMRPSDQRTVEYMQNRTGEQEYTTRREKPKKLFESDAFDTTQESYNTRYLIQTSELQRFNDGEAIVMTTDGWQRGQLPMWHQLSGAMRAGLSGAEFDLRPPLPAVFNSKKTEGDGTSDTDDAGERSAEGAPVEHRSATDSGGEARSETVDTDASVRSVSFCPSCGEDLEGIETGEFCPACGIEFPTQTH